MIATFGHLSQHMLLHVVLMNVVTPALIFIFRERIAALAPDVWRTWPLATASQLALIWGWHTPPVLDMAMSSPVLMAAMHASLILAAAWFWAAIFTISGEGLWRAIFALLVTGKLFCLLGILLVFAPRSIYGEMMHHTAGASALADQQLAGLIMVVACPLTYVLFGVVIAARWFLALESRVQ